ncbi:hypothetical protein Hanom_Chr04g00287601 [Helianthus anomalus]
MSLFNTSSQSSLPILVLNNLPIAFKAKGKHAHFFTIPSPSGLSVVCESKLSTPNACRANKHNASSYFKLSRQSRLPKPSFLSNCSLRVVMIILFPGAHDRNGRTRFSQSP